MLRELTSPSVAEGGRIALSERNNLCGKIQAAVLPCASWHAHALQQWHWLHAAAGALVAESAQIAAHRKRTHRLRFLKPASAPAHWLPREACHQPPQKQQTQHHKSLNTTATRPTGDMEQALACA